MKEVLQALSVCTLDEINGNCKECPYRGDGYPRCRTEWSHDVYNLIKGMQKENEALRQLLDWAVECDFGYDNLGNWWVDRFKGEIEGMGYTEGLIHLAKRYMEIFGEEDEDG